MVTQRYYNLTTCTCLINAAAPIHTSIDHYLSSFKTQELDHVDIELTLNDDAAAVAASRPALASLPSAGFRSSHPDHRYQVWAIDNQWFFMPERAPDHLIMVKKNDISVIAERQQVAAAVGVRIVRQLIMRAGEVRDGQAVHAGAVTLNGQGILIGGHPGAGKTSILTHLVGDHHALPVANDRTVLIPARDGTWHAVGVPLAWRFTPEGIGGSPRLSDGLASRNPTRGRGLVDGKLEFTPLEVSQTLRSPMVGSTRVERIVVLTRQPGGVPSARPNTTFVRQHLDFGATDFFAEDWLGIKPQLGEPTPRSRDTDAWWAALATSVPVQVLSWSDPIELPQIAATVAQGQP